MYFDAHTHLNSPQLFPKYKEFIENFTKIGGKKIVNVGVDYSRTEKALKIENNFPKICYSTGGFHPTEPIFKYKKNKYEFNKNKEVSWKEYINLSKEYSENLCKENKIIAIGECGMDFHYFQNLKEGQTKNEVIKQQEELFIMQIELADKYNLPIVIHSRDAFYETIEILENYKHLKIYFHCWGYGKKEIQKAQEIFPNIWFGFDGNITYKKAEDLRESIKKCELNQILLETDAPYLTPQIIRKEMNQPANIIYIYNYVSELLNLKINNLKEQIENNFNKFYNLKN